MFYNTDKIHRCTEINNKKNHCHSNFNLYGFILFNTAYKKLNTN